jgi:3-isopropylmalate dehydrogenase
MNVNLVLLPGDGIGPEIVNVTAELLTLVAKKFGHEFKMESCHFGGIAIDVTGSPLPDETLQACLAADAVLLGAVGGPKWDQGGPRPEAGLLGLRKQMQLFANLRPIQPNPELVSASPLRPERLVGVDFLVVRELTGGIYFGEPKERRQVNGLETAVDTMVYNTAEVERVSRYAFELARTRRKKLTSVDKANILETSRLWRETVKRVAVDYPDVTLEHLLVDAAAMHLITRPASFDVIVTSNMFGDLPSASIGADKNRFGFPRGLYEPIHGSAPDIAGKGIANPVGTLLSAASLLRFSLGLEEEAALIEKAVDETLKAGYRTADTAAPGQPSLNTQQFKSKIEEQIERI